MCRNMGGREDLKVWRNIKPFWRSVHAYLNVIHVKRGTLDTIRIFEVTTVVDTTCRFPLAMAKLAVGEHQVQLFRTECSPTPSTKVRSKGGISCVLRGSISTSRESDHATQWFRIHAGGISAQWREVMVRSAVKPQPGSGLSTTVVYSRTLAYHCTWNHECGTSSNLCHASMLDHCGRLAVARRLVLAFRRTLRVSPPPYPTSEIPWRTNVRNERQRATAL